MLKLYSLKKLQGRMTRFILFLMAILLAQQIMAHPNIDSSGPVIRFFSPVSGRTGTTVAIHGAHFTGAVDVSFGGVSVDSFTVAADSLIHALVGNGASGAVRVTTPFGTDSACCFTYLRDTFPPDSFPPDVTGFTPNTGRNGTVVNIFGKHFHKVTGVSFGGVPAASFTDLSDSLIRATLGNGASGAVRVSTIFGTDSLAGFTYIRDTLPPDITAFSPTSGGTGTVVNIFGTHFSNTVSVSFGNFSAASFTVVADTMIRATVGFGATGSVRVSTPFGTDSLGGFTFIRDSIPPDITSFNPTSAAMGTTVTIFGTHLRNTLFVSFGRVPAASFSVISDSMVTAIVGNGASGAVYITAISGTDTLGGFVYIRDSIPPDITSFTPTSAVRGATVSIFGTHLGNTTSVSFGGVPAQYFLVFSDSLVKAIVGNGASGAVRVTTSAGTDSLGGFTFIRDSIPPDITSFTPTSTARGTTVNIFGKHLRNTTSVSFGGVPALYFSVFSDSLVRAIVGNGASGAVRVTTTAGSDSLGGFTFIRDSIPPDITSFTPTSAATGTTVNIFGTHLRNTTSVSFGGVPATSFSVYSDSLVRAIVGNGATGAVRVSTTLGSDSACCFTFIRDSFPPDVITFNPTSGRTGTVVNIFGTGFKGANTVRFGNVPAASFAILSDSLIRAVVGNGATGAVRVSTTLGSDSACCFTFIKDSFPPDIITFSPKSGTTGTVVTIGGTGFIGATSVSFGGIPAASFSILSDSIIRAVVDTGATGVVRVRTGAGTDTMGTFTYLQTYSSERTITVAPNPASGYTIVIHPASAGHAQLKLTDITGNVIRVVRISPNALQTRFNLSGVKPGVYKLGYSDGSKWYSSTLLIQ